MSTSPLVSLIVLIVHDDQRIGATLRSCIDQSMHDVEIICVAGSMPADPALAERKAADPRVRIARSEDSSASGLRRTGVSAATAPYVLFLEPGDELISGAAEDAHKKATQGNADIVGFADATGAQDGVVSERMQKARNTVLHEENIVRGLFPANAGSHGRVTGFLFRTELLRAVYTALPAGSSDDAVEVFLACAAARTYAPLGESAHLRLSGRGSAEVAHSSAALSQDMGSLDAVTAIQPIVREWARHSPNPEPLLDGYEALRLSGVARALARVHRVPEARQMQEIKPLRARIDEIDIIAAASTFAPETLPTLTRLGTSIELGRKPVRNVLLRTNILTTGGVSNVLRTQAQVFLDAGYGVTIATHLHGSDESLVPEGATLVAVSGSSRRDRLARWVEVCREHEVDVVIDHRVLYSRDWPGYALAARASGAATIGWLHNFAGRPTYNGTDLHTLLHDNLPALAQLIVLSPLDVAFWKLRGIPRTAFLPNPPSPMLLGSAGDVAPKPAPVGRRLEVVWWGRLEEHTKKVTHLVEVARSLKRLGVDFRLRIIGPDWTDMSAAQLSTLVTRRGLDDVVDVIGPRHGDDLLEAIDSSDIFINTSIIEGYLLTIPEAQSRGLPVVMYDLPWLLPVQDNPGVIAVRQGDANALAAAVAALAADPDRYSALSRASIAAAERATSYDFAALYQQLVSGTLPAEYSPEPTLEDARVSLDLLVFYAERNAEQSVEAAKASANGRARATSASRSIGQRVEGKLTGTGHRVLALAPWLRPLARRVKHALLRS
ncbi:glycosyltransferase [Microbacterium sp. CFH 31415]|uniref:glycosyltransferase n=1 Tax=Microbacterium sp. CFH 31415 TaxID=2921732 RepID=UPI001F12C7CF|nr:glycosyltransferase [Microbacterium sp. CFH 31415]MCH6231724.1 glycosyltransferase [Microbacterium sp. CFH 31415]